MNNAEVVARRILPIIIVLSWVLNPVARSFTVLSKVRVFSLCTLFALLWSFLTRITVRSCLFLCISVHVRLPCNTSVLSRWRCMQIAQFEPMYHSFFFVRRAVDRGHVWASFTKITFVSPCAHSNRCFHSACTLFWSCRFDSRTSDTSNLR